MSVPRKNFKFHQGEDAEISIVYKEGDPPVPVDLTQGWSVRMDVRTAGEPNVLATYLYTFNSEDISGSDGDPSQPVDSVGSSDNEVVLGSDGNIIINIPRSSSISPGVLSGHLNKPLNYDIFVRSPQNKQRKVLEGVIFILPSATRWP